MGKVRGGVDPKAGARLLRHVHGEEQAGLGERRGGEGEQSKAKEEAQQQQQQHQEQGQEDDRACSLAREERGKGEEDNQTKEHGEQQGADPNGRLEQPSLEDRATPTQSSSCQGILVISLPLNIPKNIISALYM